jgi:hypothetical protein
MLCERRVTDIFCQPLVVLRDAFAALIRGVSSLQLFQDARRKTRVHEIIRVFAHHSRTSPLPLLLLQLISCPPPQPKHLSVKLVRESLRPRR